MGIEIPQQYGGGGMSFMSAILAIEEVAKVDGSVSVFMDVQNTLVNNAVIRWGTEKQKEQWLTRLASDTVGSFCLSEWSCGSDAFALRTTAKKDGDSYILNGTKAWITNSKEAGLFLVMATVDLSAGHRGITAFLVDKNTPGLSIGKKEDKLGIRASSTCEVVLENCRVPASSVLGEVGKGYKIAIETLNEGRIGIGAQMLGVAEGCFDHTMKYINERKAFGQHVADFQGVQFQYASMYSDILAAKLLVYNAARLKEANQPFVIDAAIAKLRASEVAEKVSSLCVNLMGGVGFTKEFPIEKYFRDCKIGQIYEGTSNIQLQTVAKYIQQQYK
jgi:alkylation response protein AidB-like acyl-CoA dehydrogenase